MENFKKIKIVPSAFLNAVTVMFQVFIHCFFSSLQRLYKYLFLTKVWQGEASKLLISL